ncbi:hypothetical protein E4T48_07562 [Aureobasidium sp. EXF-10727]|nr:hypothetical protein E4T48_07562 [Aureobasidium sp. EXF-10727]
MASAAAAVPTQTPCIIFDSGKAGLISIVEEELPTDVESPLASPSPQAPTWRKVDYFGKLETKNIRGLGVPSASGTGSPLASNPGSGSPETSPRIASPRISIAGWGMIPPRYTPHLGTNSQYSHAELWSQASPKLPQLSSVIPDISDDEASRHGSIAELEIFLRKASIVQSLTEKGSGTKSDIEILISEESSDVLGPLHSPLTPLTPSIRTSASPRASSECLGKTSSHEDQNVTSATTPKRPHLDRASVFKQINNFADLHSFSFRQAPKARKQSGATPDPMSMDGGIQRPASARVSLASSVLNDATQDVMLVNPITGERRMSIIRPSLAGEQLAQPSLLRRSSSATPMYTLVRRDSLLVGGRRNPSTGSRPSLSTRNSSIRSSSDIRSGSSAHLSLPQTPMSGDGQRNRNLSASTRHMSSASNARTMSSARTMSTMSQSSYARTMSTSAWSRTMSTFTRASSTSSVTTYDVESARDNSQQLQSDCVDTQTRRKSSSFVPLFGQFQWNKTNSAVELPMSEPEPAYQEALAGVEEDPDFVEVEVKSKAGSIARRASLLANVFTNQDVDVDPDLKFEPSASEAEIKQGIAQAQNERSLRKMVYSRNFAIASLAMINAFCIALSFGLFSVWYATAPLILAAPLLRSTMVVDLLISHTYKKARLLLKPQREEPEVPVMDYATVISFSNESLEDIQSTLDSLVDQKDVDMHKNLLLISCNDNVWNSDCAKSTTRIILEHILTNIVDEAKFRMPRDGPGTGYDTMWCRRGIYKGLPYVLMVKEGVTKRIDVLDLSRNLLHAYNLRKESYFNSVPSAFFAWYKEWAELHDFASFDFLANISSESILDEHGISQLYSQFLQSPNCVAVSSRVEIDPRSSRWSVGNLFSNSHLVYDQVRSFHQTHIMQKASVSPSACQMLKICEETCGPHVLEEIKKRRPYSMSNMVKQIYSSLEEDDMMQGTPEASNLQATNAVTYTRSSTTFSEFLAQRQRVAFLTCATNLAVLCDSHMHWFERLSSAAELLAWCLPLFSLAVMVNFLRSAALQQNIPVLIVLSAVVALPWIYAFASAMWLARSWDARLRHLVGFPILIVTGPFVAIYVAVSTIFNSHRLRPEQPRRRCSSAITAQIQRSDV